MGREVGRIEGGVADQQIINKSVEGQRLVSFEANLQRSVGGHSHAAGVGLEVAGDAVEIEGHPQTGAMDDGEVMPLTVGRQNEIGKHIGHRIHGESQAAARSEPEFVAASTAVIEDHFAIGIGRAGKRFDPGGEGGVPGGDQPALGVGVRRQLAGFDVQGQALAARGFVDEEETAADGLQSDWISSEVEAPKSERFGCLQAGIRLARHFYAQSHGIGRRAVIANAKFHHVLSGPKKRVKLGG